MCAGVVRGVKYLQLNTSHLLGGIKLSKELGWSAEREKEPRREVQCKTHMEDKPTTIKRPGARLFF